MIKQPRLLAALFLIACVVGCARNPNVEILGSYFPGWMLSLVLGVALSFAAHAFFRKQGLSYMIGHPAVVYPSLVVFFTVLFWLCVFA